MARDDGKRILVSSILIVDRPGKPSQTPAAVTGSEAAISVGSACQSFYESVPGSVMLKERVVLALGLVVLATAAFADEARDCIQDKDPDLAIRACSALIQADAGNPALYNRRGNAYRAKGNYDEAIADHTRAIDIDPQSAVAFSNRCFDFVHKMEPDRAIADCNKAIELNPKFSVAYFNRGMAFERKRAYDQAIADHSKAIEINPKLARAYNARAWTYFKAGKAALGLPDAQKALELRPDDPALLDTRGHILEALGKRKEAIADFRQALAKDPSLKESIAAMKRLKVKP